MKSGRIQIVEIYCSILSTQPNVSKRKNSHRCLVNTVAVNGVFRRGNNPPVLPGEEKGFSKAKNGELKAAEVVANN